MKYKTDVYNPSDNYGKAYKIRELAAHHKHPWKKVSRKIGRALTIFWHKVVSLLGSHEIVGMGDILGWARKVEGRMGRGGTWLELDLCEMFMSVPRD